MIAMLSQGLAVVVGMGSVALYLAAFFFPEVHRRHDFFWSGVGCVYALVLWACASQVSPTELVGHLASVSLLGWMGWQTLTLRRRRTPITLQTPYTEDSWPTFRREMTDLAQGFLRQSPLGRWLPDGGEPQSAQSPTAGLRVSSLKDVGYEFLDEVDPVASERGIGVLRSPATPTNPTALPQTPQPSRPKPSPARAVPASQIPTSQIPTGSTSASKAQAQPRRSLWQTGTVLATWVQDLVGAVKKPKPKRAVIEIPPRPPSIPTAKPATPPPAAPQPVRDKPSGVSPDVAPSMSPNVSSDLSPDSPSSETVAGSGAVQKGTQPEEESNWDDSNWPPAQDGDDDEDWI